MCKFIEKLFGGGGDKGTDQALLDAQTRQSAAASAALAAQQQAAAQAKAASDTQSEQTKQAAEQRMRKLLAAGPFGAALPTDFGAAPVATRQLFGA